MQSSSGKRAIVHQKAPILSSIQSAIDGRKKKQPIRTKEDRSLYKNISSKSARVAHKNFAISLLENNGVNALLASVKKDIDGEKQKIKDEDIIRYFQVSTFFLKFLGCLISKREASSIEKCGGLESVTMIMNKRNFIFVIKKLESFQDDKKPEELRQTLTCFKEMLMTLKEMSNSENEDLQELASSIEHNVFYEEKQLNMLNVLCKHCKNESKSYLELLVETIHIHMKLLERFSKAKKVVVIRKKRGNGNEDDNDGNVEDVRRGPKYIEKELKLEQMEAAYACESVVDTYCDLLRHFTLLDSQHIHYITTMMHRIFVKCKMEAFFYKLSVFNLFQQVLPRKDLLQSSPQHKQLETFIMFVLKKFFKNLQDYPQLYIDLFFKKTKSDCIRIQDMDVELPSSSSAKKNADEGIGSDDEVAFKPGIPWKSRIGIAVTLLMEKDKKWLLDWLVENMKQVIADRSEGKVNEEGEEEEYILPNTTLETKDALVKDKMFALLLRSMLFSLYEEESEELNVWSIPTFLSPYDLEERMDLILQSMETPYEENGKNAMAMIKRRKKRGSKIKDFNSADELEIKKGVPWEEQVGIAVTVLVQKKKQWMLHWLQEILNAVAETRLTSEHTSDYVLPTPTEEHELALCRDNQFGLLLKLFLFHFDQSSEKQRVWKIPKSLTAKDLMDKRAMIAHYIDHPYRKEGKTAAEMLRKKKPRKKREPKEGSTGRSRKQNKKDEQKNFLSAEFIEDSDDMDDDEFFKKEAERRSKIAEINNRIAGGSVSVNKEKFKLSSLKDSDNDHDGDDEDMDDEPPPPSPPAAAVSSSSKTYGKLKKTVAMSVEEKMAAKAKAEAAMDAEKDSDSDRKISSESESSSDDNSDMSASSSSESETDEKPPVDEKPKDNIQDTVSPPAAKKKARRLMISDDEDE